MGFSNVYIVDEEAILRTQPGILKCRLIPTKRNLWQMPADVGVQIDPAMVFVRIIANNSAEKRICIILIGYAVIFLKWFTSGIFGRFIAFFIFMIIVYAMKAIYRKAW